MNATANSSRPWLRLLLATTALAPLGVLPATANPQGPQVVGGSAAVQGTGTPTVTVTQSSQRAVINWNSFNIGAGERTQFVQPSASATVLNRVTGDPNPSQINGTLTANGRVFVINPNGVLIGNGAVVNTAGFLATTHDIKNEDFMGGRYNFNIPGRPDASVVNNGTITASNGGFAALVAPGVRNTGTITANFGKIGLASANGFSLDLYGDSLIRLGVSDSIAASVKDAATGQTLKSLVQNDGKLKANGGRVELSAVTARKLVDSVINTSGVIEARSIGHHNGKIVLGGPSASTKLVGAPTQTVKVSGTLSVAGKKKAKGGTVQIIGEDIVLSAAAIDASGAAGGGKVLIGGDVGGGHVNPLVASLPQAQLEAAAVPTATRVSIDAATRIDASAKTNGDGGKVVVWSDGNTAFEGSITVAGGASGGNGGFAEVSGHQSLAFAGTVNSLAPHGSAGTLLLDPADLYIDIPGGPTRPGGASVITNTTVQGLLSTGNVLVATNNAVSPGGQNGDIFVTSNINWATGNTLTLSAFRNIEISDGVTIANTGAGNLILRADSTGIGTGTIDFLPGISPALVDFTNSTGKVAIYYDPVPGGMIFPTPKYTNPNNYAPNVLTASPSQFTSSMLVNDAADLQAVSTNVAGIYAVGADINASPFLGIGPLIFTGIFDGNGGLGVNQTISNLQVGLLPTIGTGGIVRNLNLKGSLTTTPALLANLNQGSVQYVTASGTINTSSWAGSVGGLVANNAGTIDQSWAEVSTTTTVAGFDAGGLVGSNTGFITNSYATGAVNGARFGGGLVGFNSASIATSYSTGPVSAGTTAGGLVGVNSGGTVTNSYWDMGTSLQTASGGGTGLTTAQMHDWTNYTGFDFETIWAPPSPNTHSSDNLAHYSELYALGRIIWVRPDDKTRQYGDANPPFTAQMFGFRDGDTSAIVSGLVLSTPATAASNVGAYPIDGSGASTIGVDPYRIVYTTAALNVTTRGAAVTVTADNASKIYGDTLTFAGTEFSSSGLINGDSIASVTLTSAGAAATAPASVTPYSIVASNAVGTGLANYSITYVDGALTVSPRPLTVTADPKARAYGDANPALTYTVGGGGLVNGDVLSGALATIATTASGAGFYPITQGTVAASPNYALSYVGANLTVGSRTLTVTADPKSRAYGDANPALTYTVGGGGLVNGDTLSGVLVTAAVVTSGVGAYPITQGSLSAPTNYALTYTGANLTVDPRVLTVTVDPRSRGYGDANPALTYTVGGGGLVNGDTLAGALATVATTASSVGSYSITQGTLAASPNYALTYNAANLAVDPRALTVTADSKFRAYGDANPALTYTVGGGGLVNDDTLSGALATAATVTSGVGSYSITQGTLAASPNYALTYNAANLAVDPRALTVTADPKSRAYGDANPPLTYAIGGGGLVNGDTLGGALATMATGASGVGSYAITQGTLAASPNYALTYNAANLAIDPRALTVAANPQQRVYGDANPPLTYTVGEGGLVNGDTLAGALATAATTASGVGVYKITQGTLSASPNYALSYSGADLTIDARPVTGTANPQVRGFGADNPPLTYSIGGGGLVNGDMLSGSLATAANANSVSGFYPITQGTLSGLPNYALTYAGADLRVLAAPPPPPQFQIVLRNDAPFITASLTPPLIDPSSVLSAPRGPGLGQLPLRNFVVPLRSDTQYVQDEVLVWVRIGTAQSDVDAAANRAGLTLLQSEDLSAIGLRLVRFRIPPGSTVARTIPALSSFAAFIGASANHRYALAQQPDVAALPSYPAGDASQYIVGKFHLSDIHRLAKGADVKIAVIDSKIDADHSDLKGVVAESFDVTSAKADRHGTGMAGAIAAHHRLLGIAPSVRLLAIDAFTATNSSSAEGTTYNILRGIDWAIRRSARVINMSFTGPRDPLLEHALGVAHDRGIVLVAAAGNAGPKSPPLFPGADSHVIAVTATDSQDKLFAMANRGSYVGVAAPGVDVLATAPQESYEMSTGTSIATAHVSGVIALMLERDPSLGPDQVRRFLESTATDLGPKGKDPGFGHGLVNPQKALEAVAARLNASTASPQLPNPGSR